MTEFSCENCKVIVKWLNDETTQKARLLEVNSEIWHDCNLKNTTIVNQKALKWFCMECMSDIDIANHPCIHYQKSPDRVSIRYGIVMKKNKNQYSVTLKNPMCGICNRNLKNLNFEQREKHLEICKPQQKIFHKPFTE